MQWNSVAVDLITSVRSASSAVQSDWMARKWSRLGSPSGAWRAKSAAAVRAEADRFPESEHALDFVV